MRRCPEQADVHACRRHDNALVPIRARCGLLAAAVLALALVVRSSPVMALVPFVVVRRVVVHALLRPISASVRVQGVSRLVRDAGVRCDALAPALLQTCTSAPPLP
ncbi:MAG TPA: hypothetical protein VGS80_08045 [Ktedonobacterales bacterium]|nr:hypothetical protein [Ktedonobacterales bacterium]